MLQIALPEVPFRLQNCTNDLPLVRLNYLIVGSSNEAAGIGSKEPVAKRHHEVSGSLALLL